MAHLTTPAIERQVARLLGAEPDVARAAVAAIAEQGALAHGVLLLAVMGAARWGTDACGAIERIAEGTPVPSGWSDYERRVAAEEAPEDSAAALARVRAQPGAAAFEADAEVAAEAVTEAAGLDEAVDALLAGAAELRLTEPVAVTELAFLRVLCAQAGARLDAPAPTPDDGAIARSGDALDLIVW